jgi:hypothetical protein
VKQTARAECVLTLFFCAACAAGCGSTRPPQVERPPAPPATSRPVLRTPIGALGLPLGTVAEIRVTVFAGRELRMKRYDGEYLLRVTHVNGNELSEPQFVEFGVPAFLRKGLARTPHELYEIRHGRKAASLDDRQIERLERGYVGKEFKLTAYETGRFDGIPSNWPSDVPMWADHGFGFSTSLVVLAER